ncbi:MAG: prepilin-type N-terminal cleavage/methylation domain-containing protein [Candidatus Saccharimonadales bacterium]
MRKLMNRQKGFTIVELLVVIVVIAILATLTIPQVLNYFQRGRDLDRKNDLRVIQQSSEEYYTDNEYYPTATSGLVPDYISEVPTDPQTSNAYTYTPAPPACDNTAGNNCTSYTLTADLENDNDRDADASGNYILNSLNQ